MEPLTGKFLVATEWLQDPNFRQTVVLMIQHNNEGAFGIVVNRQAQVEGGPFPVYVGGPCESEGLLMVHGHPEWILDEEERQKHEIAPGIYMGDAEAVERITEGIDTEDYRFRIVVGYAGWGADQLEGELVSHAWTLTPANGELLFDTPPEELWSALEPPPFPEPSSN